MSPDTDRVTLHQPACYQICVRGTLSERWYDYVQGMAIVVDCDADGEPTTVLTGQLIDQASLRGVLDVLYELHLPIISVVRLREDCGSSPFEYTSEEETE